MRHRRRGRKLGRNPSHQRALLRSLASALILTERDMEDLRFIDLESEPKVPGRIVTTISKAKEVRPLVEKCVTIAKKSLPAARKAAELQPSAARGSDEWKKWREGDGWREWNATIAPTVAARRRCLKLLGDKNAVAVLFEEVAPRFEDRPGGYTRVLRLAQPRLGDAGTQAILEFVGKNDRVVEKSAKPAFAADDDEPETAGTPAEEETAAEESAAEAAPAEEASAEEASAEKGDEKKA